jgi:hypothetical protein
MLHEIDPRSSPADSNPEAKEAIHRLAKGGHILEAVTLSTDLVRRITSNIPFLLS